MILSKIFGVLEAEALKAIVLNSLGMACPNYNPGKLKKNGDIWGI